MPIVDHTACSSTIGLIKMHGLSHIIKLKLRRLNNSAAVATVGLSYAPTVW